MSRPCDQVPRQVTIVDMPTSPPADDRVAAAVRAIDDAGDETSLRTAFGNAVAAVAAGVGAHAPASALAATWSEVLSRGTAAGVRLAGPAAWTWYVSGSVARGEAALGSDVETLVVLADTVSDEAKVELLSRAADVHALLERCGIPGDANGVLASRPRFCRRAASWTEGIHRWARDPREDRGAVMTGLLADCTGLSAAAESPVALLQNEIAAAVTGNAPIRRALLQDATAVRASIPSRLRLLARASDDVDVKLAALDPVVKIARWAALSAGSTALSTERRLDDAAAAAVLDADDAATLQNCFASLLRLRWRLRPAAFLAGEAVDDVVSLAGMAPQDRAMLRGVAREVSGIARKLTYLASTGAFG